MAERTALWYRHNASGASGRSSSWRWAPSGATDTLPDLRRTSPAAIEIERSLLRPIISHEEIDDDKVVPDHFSVNWRIHIDEFGIEIPTDRGEDAQGREIAYHWQHPIKTLKQDFGKLKPATFSVDRAGHARLESVRRRGAGRHPAGRDQEQQPGLARRACAKVVRLMSLEQMMYAMMDEPDDGGTR